MMKKNIRIGIAGAVLIVLMIAAGVFIEQKMKLEEPVFLTGGMLPEKTVLLIRDDELGQARFAIPLHVLQTRVMMT